MARLLPARAHLSPRMHWRNRRRVRRRTSGRSFVYNLRFPGQYYDAETGLNYNMARDYDPAVGRYVESDPIGLDGGDDTYAYVANGPLAFVDPLGLVKECITKLMLVTAYDDRGPGRDWAYYKSHPGGVGPNTVAVANTSPPPYPFGTTFNVLNEDGAVAYSGVAHDTGAGWDEGHHDVPPDQWIDIWVPRSPGKHKHRNANRWGKQWRNVTICQEKCQK